MSISFRGIQRSVNGVEQRRTVLDGFDLHVEEGKAVALMGRTGSGKSTLARLAAGFETPDDGCVLVAGSAVERGVPHTSLGYMTQSAERMTFPWMSVWNNLTAGLRLRGRFDLQARRECEDLMECLGITHLRDVFTYNVSGGELKRLSLAMVLSYKPRYLVLDEPFTGLDFAVTRDVWDVLFRFLTEHQPTTLLITHSFDEASLLADRVAFISRTGKCLPSERSSVDFHLPRTMPRYQLQTVPECVTYQQHLIGTFDRALLA